MSDWQTVKIASFLTEREGRYKPDDKQIRNIPRLDKIDFSGMIHLSSKPTKTDMIIVYPGDLIISGINVAKGAIAIWEGDHPITATIHYSSYTFDKKKINIDFFKRYLKSPVFVKTLQAQVKGGIKTEIKAKHLLPLEVSIPPLPLQKKTNTYFESFETELSALSGEIGKQTAFLAKLRQAVLQEAIEGKMTADWRKSNPVRKGDAEYDAKALLDKIKAEKQRLVAEGKIRKEKTLMPIKVEDVPFLLPEGWVWTRLGDLCSSITYGTSKSCSYNESLNSKILRIPNVSSGSIDDTDLKYTELSGEEIRELSLANGDILMIRSNGSTEIVGTMAYVSEKFTGYCFAGYLIRLRFCVPIIGKFLSRISKSALIRAYIQMPLRTTVGINNINTQEISNIPIPLPPLAEQRAIVLRVEEILSMIDGLEAQVKERKGQTEGVLQVVLREVFEGVDLK